MKTPFRILSLLALVACTASKTSTTDTGIAGTMTHDTGMVASANDESAAKDAIQKMRSGWQANANKKDAAAVASYYADDAILVGTEIPYASGRAEIQKRFEASFPISKVERIDAEETIVKGDLAYDYGTFRQEVTPPNAKAQMVSGYYLVVARRQADGSWKITRHIATTPPVKP